MSAKTPQARVLLIEAHPITRRGLTGLVNSQPDMTVCGGAASLPEAQDQVAKCMPDIVVLDFTLNGTNGIEPLKHVKIRFSHLKVLILSVHDENYMRCARSTAAPLD